MEKSAKSAYETVYEKYVHWTDYNLVVLGELYETIDNVICYPVGKWKTVCVKQQILDPKIIVVPVSKSKDCLETDYFHFCLDFLVLNSKTQKLVKLTCRLSEFEEFLGVPLAPLKTLNR